MERLKRVILEYEETIERLKSGQEKVHRTGRFGEKEDISVQTADHYRRLLSHYTEIVARNEASTTKPRKKK